MVLIEIDRHEARKTGAYIRWYVVGLGPIEEVYRPLLSSASPSKTHWREAYDIPIGTKLIRVRYNNRGNFTIQLYEVTEQGLKLIKAERELKRIAEILTK